MQKEKRLNLIGIALLLSATLVWGTSFAILKQTIETVPVFYVIAVRFLIASVLLGLIFIKKTVKIDKKTLLCGIFLGMLLATAYITQTLGLKYTTPSRNAFLTSSYCVLCPFLLWLLFKKKPKGYNIISALLCIVGIGLVAFSGKSETGSNLILGDGLTLLSAVFFGLQIIMIDKFQSQGKDAFKLLVPEILTVGVIFTVLSLIFELPQGIQSYALNGDQLGKIFYLTLICTLYAQLAQITGQKFVTANQSSIVLSLEAVFGTLFSVIISDEKLSVMLVLGFLVIFIAMMVSELKLDPSKIIFRKKRLKFDKNESEIEK